MPDLLVEKFGLALVLRRREAVRKVDFEDKVTSPEWGNLKPASCKFSLRAKSLIEAYTLLEELRLAPVPADLCETFLASGGPFSSQVEGLVEKESGRYYAREPWEVIVTTSAGEQLKWALVKTAGSHQPQNLRDGESVAREPLLGPLSSHQVAKEVTSNHLIISNIVKTKRRKKTTVAKRVQLQDPKLFKVCRLKEGIEDRGGGQRKKKSHNPGGVTGDQILQKQKQKQRKRKPSKKKDLKQSVQGTEVQAKGGSKKYRHLQAFVGKRRQKRQEKVRQERLAFEEKWRDGKSSLDLNAEVCTHF